MLFEFVSRALARERERERERERLGEMIKKINVEL